MKSGIDIASHSFIAWCACGWRVIRTTKDAAIQINREHRATIHGTGVGA